MQVEHIAAWYRHLALQWTVIQGTHEFGAMLSAPEVRVALEMVRACNARAGNYRWASLSCSGEWHYPSLLGGHHPYKPLEPISRFEKRMHALYVKGDTSAYGAGDYYV